MKEKYFELIIRSQKIYDELLELLFSFGITCIEQRNDEIIVRDEDDLSLICAGVVEYAKKLCASKNISNDVTTELTQKDNKDWIQEYKKGVKPILLDKFYIHPSWEEPKQGLTNIIIDPALAFGSGHHESTSSCLLFLQKYAKSTDECIDVGCGSGILSIALAKLGCKIDACDTDELAVRSSIENAKLNGVEFNKIWNGSISALGQKYDIVVANIIADVIFILANDLKNIMKNSAYLVLSGILNRYEERIISTFSDLELVEKKQLNDWSSFVFKNK